MIRLFEKEPNRSFNLILKPDLMPNQKTDIHNNGPFSTDTIGMNYDYAEAGYSKRVFFKKNMNYIIKGLCILSAMMNECRNIYVRKC